MGCICSKGTADGEISFNQSETKKENEFDKLSVQLVAPIPSMKEEDVKKAVVPLAEDSGKILDRSPSKRRHQRCPTMDLGSSRNNQQNIVTKINSMPHSSQTELTAAGWPKWLTSAAGEAIKGWLPRRADSFEQLEKIGQGTYSSVYKARDLDSGKIVAMKKVRFVKMDPESVRFMAREIHILRKLDHPNIMKLEGIVTSRMCGSLYLVFEYMEHDLAGLAATPGIKFTQQQIKCYMQQLLRGLEHCHSRRVLHRDIKGSNLLLNDKGELKIGDFGLATFYQPDKKQALTSRVVTLWYRAPELLLGATEYGEAIDMWSAGCILAELFAGKPIMTGRTEVEQMHKIFKLCGSPSKEYWQKTKLPHATSFKPQNSYKRCVTETFRNFPPSALSLIDKLLSMEPEARGSATSALNSKFFNSEPFPCDPSSLPKYPPTKELDAKVREEEARRRKAEEKSTRRDVQELIPQGQAKTNSTNYKYHIQQDVGSGFPMEPPNKSKQSSTVIHPTMLKKNSGSSVHSNNNTELRTNITYLPQATVDIYNSSLMKDNMRDSTENFRRKNRIHYSGPLMPPGGNIEEMLKEHERQIQQAVRKARMGKSGTKDRIYS